MVTKLLRSPALWSALALAVAGRALVVSLGSLPEAQVERDWFNGDTLFPFHLAKDVLQDGNAFAGWQLPVAPYLFPDIPLAAACQLVGGGNVPCTALAYGFLQFALLTGGFLACVRALGLPRRGLADAGVLAAATALTLLSAAG